MSWRKGMQGKGHREYGRAEFGTLNGVARR